jgi:hypothetical protein
MGTTLSFTGRKKEGEERGRRSERRVRSRSRTRVGVL